MPDDQRDDLADEDDETVAMLEDEATMAALGESDEDPVAGRIRPYEDVRHDLGFTRASTD